MQASPPIKKKSNLILIILAGLFGLCLVCVAISTAMQKAGLLPTPTPTTQPSSTPPPSATPLPTASPEPEQALNQLIVKTLGEGVRVKPRLTKLVWKSDEKSIFIQFAIEDNFTTEMRTIGFESDIMNMLKAIYQSNLPLDYEEISFAGTFSLVDVYGNVTEEIVVSATYSKDMIAKINWDNFLFENVFKIADFSYIDPVMLK